MEKKRFDCFILKLKEYKVKNKTKYELIGVTAYQGLSKELACYYVVNESYRYTGIKHREPCKFSEADSIVGYNYCGNDITFCFAQKRYITREVEKDPISIYPKIDYCGFEINKSIKEQIHHYIDLMKKMEKEEDLSVECYHIWAPESLIPKGYEHITNGKVVTGDYYWEHYYKPNHWQNVDVSFSRFKPGTEIKTSGICFKNGKTGTESEDEIVNFYHPFIIRKKNIHP